MRKKQSEQKSEADKKEIITEFGVKHINNLIDSLQARKISHDEFKVLCDNIDEKIYFMCVEEELYVEDIMEEIQKRMD